MSANVVVATIQRMINFEIMFDLKLKSAHKLCSKREEEENSCQGKKTIVRGLWTVRVETGGWVVGGRSSH